MSDDLNPTGSSGRELKAGRAGVLPVLGLSLVSLLAGFAAGLFFQRGSRRPISPPPLSPLDAALLAKTASLLTGRKVSPVNLAGAAQASQGAVPGSCAEAGAAAVKCNSQPEGAGCEAAVEA